MKRSVQTRYWSSRSLIIVILRYEIANMQTCKHIKSFDKSLLNHDVSR